jgi:trimeric autotransporter adhesin
VSGNFSANAGNLTVGGTVASAGGALNLTAANSVTQLANLTAARANSVTVTTAGGPITMAAAATTTSGTGGINYAAGTDVTLGSLSTGGVVNVSAGGSVLSAAGSGTNVTAGANSTLQAFNGVVGTSVAPVTVNVNPGTLSIRATTAVAGISVFLTGTVLPSNTLMLLNVPPGLVCFNGCPVTGGTGGLAGLPENAFGTLAYLNPDAIVPTYYPQPSGSVLISDITSVYMPGTLLQPSPVSLSSGDPSVQSMGPKAKAGASCKQGETVPNQQASAASLDVRCAVQ